MVIPRTLCDHPFKYYGKPARDSVALEKVKMIRRDFLQSTLAAAASLAAGKNQKLVCHVAGFTCVTCAVGLETILGRQKGVSHVEASYPSGLVTIEFDPALISDKSLRASISEMGFRIL